MIDKFKDYIVHWNKQDQVIVMLKYIKELEGEKLDNLLLAIMEKLRDPKESNVLVSNGLTALINQNFLDSSVSYHRYLKAKDFMRRSKDEL